MWLIHTKLEAPAPTERLIARQRLRRRLPAILRSRLALVHAPAGFGKTCVLAEWRRCLAAQRVRTAWLSLDEDDSEPLQFLAYLTASLAAAGVDMGSLGSAAERGLPDVPVPSLVAALDQCVRRTRGRTVVMLDDYHRLRRPEVHRAVAALIHALGARVTFVIAARELPRALAEDASLQASCVEIAGDELRFTADETQSLLERTVGRVTPDDVRVIVAGTDGWAIAVAAVRDWLQSGWSADRVREALSRPGADLGRYVTEQILASLGAPEHEFLLRTAIVDRFSAGLARSLAADLRVDDLIAALERKDLVVAMRDANGTWYRYHRLLTELALARLASARPYLVDELHRRAATWFFDAGLHAEAVQHALATGDHQLLAEMFERAGGWRLVIAGYVGLARNALTLIPPEVLREYPRAQLARVLVLAKLGQVDVARAEVERFRGTHLRRADATLAAECALLVACIDRYADEPVTAETIEEFVRLADALPPDDDVLRATHANILTTLQHEHGDLDAALETAFRATVHYRRMHSLFEVFVYVHQGSTLLESGRVRDAVETLRQAWQLARDTTGPNTETEAIAAAMLATALYARGERDEAQRLLDAALPGIENGESWYDVLAAAYRTALQLALGAGDPPAARRVVARARATAERRDMLRLRVQADVLAVHAFAAHVCRAADPEADAVARRLRDSVATLGNVRLASDASLALAALALSRGDARSAHAAAVRVVDEARRGPRRRTLLEARLLEVASLTALGEAASARLAFEAALALAMHEGWLQPFVDCGPSVREWFSLDATPVRPLRVRDRFLESIERATRRVAAPEPALALSERERAVAGLLGKGLSNKAIGRAMRVSDNTVKFHLKNIYAKLGVCTRREAARVLSGTRVTDAARN